LLSIYSLLFWSLFTFNYLINCKEPVIYHTPRVGKVSLFFTFVSYLESCALRCLRRLLQLLQEFA
jgi:hypothetical protein